MEMPTYIEVEFSVSTGRIRNKLYLRSDGEDEHFYIFATARNSDTPNGPLMMVRFPKECK